MSWNHTAFMKANYKIRKAKTSDALEIARIQRIAFTEMIGHYFGTDTGSEKKIRRVTDKLFLLMVKAMKDEIFVAEADGKIVGNIIAPYDIRKTRRKFPSYRVFWIALARVLIAMTSVSSENRKALLSDRSGIRRLKYRDTGRKTHSRIFNIAVEPNYQGRGIGYALLKKGLRYLFIERGTGAVTLNVFAQNHNAIALYYRFGFTQKDRFVNSMGEWIVMELTRENRMKAKQEHSTKKYSTA